MRAFKSYFHPLGKKDESLAAPSAAAGTGSVRLATRTPGHSGNGSPLHSGSRPASIYPSGDFRNSNLESIMEIKSDVMVNWLHQQQLGMMYTAGGKGEGVVLKKFRDSYTCCPAELRDERDGLFDAVRRLNVKVSVEVV
jgi:hypothetical protein